MHSGLNGSCAYYENKISGMQKKVTDEQAEALCRRCGRCCYRKIILDGEVIYTPFPCKYLDEHTRLCTVYDRRHEMNPECLTLEEGIKIGVFPADCPYVRDIPDYEPPRLRMTREEFDIWMADLDARRRGE